MIYRRNFNHLIRNTHFKTLFYHYGSTYCTLTNMSALQCPDVHTCFLSEYMLERWIAKIKNKQTNKKKQPFTLLYNMLQCLKANFASISGQDELKIFLLIASAKYSLC